MSTSQKATPPKRKKEARRKSAPKKQAMAASEDATTPSLEEARRRSGRLQRLQTQRELKTGASPQAQQRRLQGPQLRAIQDAAIAAITSARPRTVVLTPAEPVPNTTRPEVTSDTEAPAVTKAPLVPRTLDFPTNAVTATTPVTTTVPLSKSTTTTTTTTVSKPPTTAKPKVDLSSNASFFVDYTFPFYLVINPNIAKKDWEFQELCYQFFSLYGTGDEAASSVDFSTGIAELMFINEASAVKARKYVGDWGTPMALLVSIQKAQNKKLMFNQSFNAFASHFSKYATEASLQKGIADVTHVPVLAVLILGAKKAIALVSVGSPADLQKITQRRRIVVNHHLIRIVRRGPRRAAVVHVQNLPKQATPDKVERMLKAWGLPPLYAAIPRQRSGRAQPFGFIYYRTSAEADALLKLNLKRHIGGHFLAFTVARKRAAKRRTPPTKRDFIKPPVGPPTLPPPQRLPQSDPMDIDDD